jgi:splicing factor, arginine/serine-rich 7
MSRFPHDAKVYVGDLGSNADKQEIEDAFSYYGPLRSVWVARNPPGTLLIDINN